MRITKIQIKGYRKFQDFVFKPEPNMNIIVGGNEAGKTTLLEAMTLALTGRINGIPAVDYLNPYWFNKTDVSTFFDRLKEGAEGLTPPEIRIDIHLDVERGDMEQLRGLNNIAKEDSAGLSLWIHPDPDYAKEIKIYFSAKDCPRIIPVEYYAVEWLDFAGAPLRKRPKDLGIAKVDSQTIRSKGSVDYYTRQILETYFDPKELNRIGVEHRRFRTNLGRDLLKNLNNTLNGEKKRYSIPTIGLQVDQSRSISWKNTLTAEIESVPLSMAGQGSQAFVKTVLALGRSQNKSSLIFIEEPENHLSHTRLRVLISAIQSEASDRQVFITTHSSYVLNRLGLNKLVLLSDAKAVRLIELDDATVKYFKRLSGFDSLRLLLADRIVLVEGPSDEIVFNRFYKDRFDNEPLDDGIDVVSINGVSFKRCFELANLLDRQLFALRDNDGQKEEHWRNTLSTNLKEGIRELFVGDIESGETLEPQIYNANKNKTSIMKELFPEKKTSIIEWMSKHKTDAALKIATTSHRLKPPKYFERVFEALSEIPNQEL